MSSADLARALRERVRGEVRFDAGTRALYAHDASAYRQVPIAVVTPRDEADVVAAIRACREHGAPILPRGGGTSLAGQCCNVAVVLDLSRHLTRVVNVDAERRVADVEAGVLLDRLRSAASPAGLTFGPDPATHDRCTLGGMIGNNACGVRSLSWGRTSDNVEELDVVTSDGEMLRVGASFAIEALDGSPSRAESLAISLRDLSERHADRIRSGFPRLPRRVSGYNLDDLLPERGSHVARSLAGSEGTCATILRARVRLVERPAATALAVLGYASLAEAADAVAALLPHRPHGLEGLDRKLLRDNSAGRRWRSNAELPRGEAWLFVEMRGASGDEARASAERAARDASAAPSHEAWRLARDADETRALWAIREAGVGTTARLPSGARTWPGWEDSAVPPARLPSYLRAFALLLDEHRLDSAIYGHFGDGCVHSRLSFDLETREGATRYRRFLDDAADLVIAHGGSLSGEHGDGQARGALLEKMFGAELLGAMREMRRIWDPQGLMNPGKKIDARPPESDLKAMGVRAMEPSAADAALASAALDCVGVGKCRKLDAGTMCPSFMATRDERHSTRGRARLLHEALRGELLPGGLDDPALLEALDLCLGCKACKTECPTGVDMTRIKSEVLSRHHEHARRAIGEIAFARIDLAARIGSRFAATANHASALPGLSSLVKGILGIAPARRLPRFAPEPFDAWWARRARANGAAQPSTRGPILLWPDTFTRYFEPGVLRAAVHVLETLGYEVRVPLLPRCCGRPLHGAGMLGEARERSHEIVAALARDIDEGIPLVGVEPGCVSFFRDELVELLPDDARARALAGRSSFFSELIAREADALKDALGPSLAGRRLILHAHCHESALIGLDALAPTLCALGADARLLDSGCCGMAGPFGFRASAFDVSQAIGERVLLPAARSLAPGETLVTDGFSCREQVEQAGLSRPLHLAQVLSEQALSRPRGS